MILPGAYLGLVGGGQLARMTALAGRRMGYRFRVLDPAGDNAPAAPVCDSIVQAPYDDLDALARFGAGLDVVGFEFENIPAASLRALEACCPVRPNWRVLEICQHREREKNFLRKHGFPHAAFEIVTDPKDLALAMERLGVPCVLKTAQSGYDGKGQLRIAPGANPNNAWLAWGGGGAGRGVAEAWVDFDAELSVVCARNGSGELRCFPVFENQHANHILSLSICPGRFAASILDQACALAFEITETLQVEGLLAVEMFLTKSGTLLVNELAPRPHNSGHLTLDACATSQFEQHTRAICGLPLGSTDLLCPAVMGNLLGNLWDAGGNPPSWAPVLETPNAKLHLYGKQGAKPGRKMGHYCVLAASREEALAEAFKIKARLEEARPG